MDDPSDRIGLLFLATLFPEREQSQLAADGLTGVDDCKMDILYIEEDSSRAIVAQCYQNTTWDKTHPPKQKATDLNSALTWLVKNNIESAPDSIRPSITLFRELLHSERLTSLEIYFVHNCGKSKQIEAELDGVRLLAKELMPSLEIQVIDIDRDTLTKRYESNNSKFGVADSIPLRLIAPVEHGLDNTEWKCTIGYMPCDQLFDLYDTYGDQLFTENLRGYLSTVTTSQNVNEGIKRSILNSPKEFIIFNNGITIITRKLNPDLDHFSVDGLSIVNGAQTTGSIHRAGKAAAENAFVVCRIIETQDPGLITEITKWNNTQNAVNSLDRRSKDTAQIRLSNEFSKYDIRYQFRRETGSLRGELWSEPVGQMLAAFHGRYTLATRSKGDIMRSDEHYNNVFNSALTAEHAYLVVCFNKAIERVKS